MLTVRSDISTHRPDIFTDMSMFTDMYGIFKDRSCIFTHRSDMLTARSDISSHRPDIFIDMSMFTDKYDFVKDRSYIFKHRFDILTARSNMFTQACYIHGYVDINR